MTQPAPSLVTVSIDQGVANVVLNRPERQNGWTPALGQSYFAVLRDLAQDESVRVIVVSGAGGHFSVGGDGEMLGEIAGAGSHEASPQSAPYWLPLSIGKPIIGAISGVCFGVGMQQALCLDFRFAAEDVKFSTAYVRRGLIAELGMSWMLPRIVGVGLAAELMLSGRIVRAEEAERMGLVNRIFPTHALLEETLAFARTMAATCSPRAMRTLKDQLYRDLMTSLLPAYDRSEVLLPEAFAWPDFAEGVNSWQEKRAPAFPPLPAELARIEVDPHAALQLD